MADQSFAEFLSSQQAGPQQGGPQQTGEPLSFADFLTEEHGRATAKPSSLVPHPDDVARATTESARTFAEQATRPPLSLRAPTLEERLQSAVRDALMPPFLREGAIGRALGLDSETDAQRERGGGGNPLFNFEAGIEDQPGAVRGVTRFASGLTTPDNLLMLAGTGGLGALEKQLGRQALSKLVSLGFSADMLWQAVRQAPELVNQVKSGNWTAARETLTNIGLSAGMSGLAAKHGLSREASPAGLRDAEAAQPSTGVHVNLGAPPAFAEFLEEENSAARRQTEAQPQGSGPATPGPSGGAQPAGAAEQPPAVPASAGAGAEAANEKPVEGSKEYFRGDWNIPLNDKGREQNAAAAERNAGQFDKIYSGTKDRHIETAKAYYDTNQHTSLLHQTEAFDPMHMGVHEGEEVTPERLADVNDRLRNKPNEPIPGVGKFSGSPGEKPADWQNRLLSKVDDLKSDWKPGEKTLVVTSGRDVQAIRAWVAKGMPADHSTDPDVLTARWETQPGEMMRFDPRTGALENTNTADKEGIYFARHGETDGNDNPAIPAEVRAQEERTASAPASAARGSAPQGIPERTPRAPVTAPAYGRGVSIAVPGERTSYEARYAIRDAADVQPSHNASSFERNPAYEHQNDRDYRTASNAARVVEQAATFNPEFVSTESPTAEHGAPVIDARGNVLGGNSRAMTLGRIYESNPSGAEAYRQALRERAASYGLKPEDVERFKRPVLVRELSGDVNPQRAITDFNKAGAAALSPAERAVTDGKRLSPETVGRIGGLLSDVGEDSTLAQAMRGDGGAEVVNALVRDGVVTPQERNGLVDERGQLTPEAKERVARMLVGRLFDSPAEFSAAPPELRNKLERVAPQVLRVEGRQDWNLAPQVREAVSALSDARAHGIRNLDDLTRQTTLNGQQRAYSPDAIAIARSLQNGPLTAARAFRQYANDEALSREGAQAAFFEPPTRLEAFDAAFGSHNGERGSAPMLNDLAEGLVRQGAGAAAALKEEVAPTVQNAARALVGATRDIKNWAVPTAFDKNAERFSLELRENLAEATRKHDRATSALASARRYFAGQKPENNYGFIDRVERGEQQPTPWERTLATPIRALLDEGRKQVQALGTGKLQEFYENYFPHIWQDPDQAGQTFRSMFSRRPFEGGKAFLKHRTYVTFRDGLDAGLKPISDNPVDLVIAKLHEMNRYIAAQKTMQWARENGEAKFVRVGQKPPIGWARVNDPIGMVQYRNDAGELVNSGDWYVPEGAAQVLNNHLSPGLAGRSALFRAALGLNNTLNQFDLGFSGFHLGTSTVTSMASRAAVGYEAMLRGRPLTGIAKLVTSPAAPLIDIITGNRAAREWLNEGAGGGDMGAMVDAVIRAGGRAKNSRMYQTGAAQRFMDVTREVGRLFRQGEVGAGLVKTGKAALLSPFAAADASVWPVLDWAVPRLKLGAFIDKARFDIDRLGPNAGPEAVRKSLAQTWDSIDNRFGEMVLDNLFWNRVLKDVAHLTVRSVGWVLGDVREFGGAAVDVARIPAQLASGTPYGEVNLNRLSFTLGYMTTTALVNAVYQYLHTGKGPEELRDYIFAKNGERDQWGRPARSALAGYTKDIWNFAHDPGATLSAKVSPLVNLISEMVRNRDFYGTEIRNANDPWLKQVADQAKHIPTAFEPMVVKNWQREKQQEAPPVRAVENYFGVGTAPASASRTKAEQLAAEINGDRARGTALTQEQTERRTLRQELSRALRENKPIPADVNQARQKGLLTRQDIREAVLDSRETYLQHAVSRLELPDTLKVWNEASPEERNQIKAMLVRKARTAMKKHPADQPRILKEMRAALAAQ